MSEQSDTPETDTAEREDAGPITHAMRGWNYARKHERERDEARKLQERTEAVLNTTTEAYKYDHDALTAEVERLRAERDEARAIANDRDAMVDHRDRALTAMYQRVDAITQERDEARAEVERLRSALGFYSQPVRYDGPNQRPIPGDPYTAADSAYMNDVCRYGGEIARAALAATEAKP